MGLLVRFDDAAAVRSRVGGKGANLARLRQRGFLVPEACAVPVEHFVDHVAACREAGAAADEDLRAAIADRPLDAELAKALDAFVAECGGRVSVRSSANLEDAHTHAFAGQFLTVLNTGPGGVADAVRAVWASTFTGNVGAYLERAGLDAARLQMAVVVQRQLDSDASGVALGDAGRAMVEAVFGQGEAVVGAEVECDHWDVQNGRVVASRTAHKGWRRGLPAGPPNGELERLALPPEMQDRPSLSRAQVLRVVELAGRLAAAFDGKPQDCEFSFVGDELFVLQTRDVTASLPVEAPPLAPFTPPGKGAWELDDTHLERPVTRLFLDRFPAAMMRGFKSATARYGALLSHLDVEFVNGFMYSRLRPVAAPEDATTRDPPPAFVFKLLSLVVPELRRRLRTAERIWTDREWRRQAAEWEEAKARTIRDNLALQRVDRPALDDRALAAHLREVDGLVDRMIEQHHTYNLAAMVPTGDFVVHATRWSGGALSPTELLGLLAGSAAASADLRSPEAVQLARAVAASADARALLRLDEAEPRPGDLAAAQALEALCALPGEVGERARTFLEQREYRLSEGLDPAAPCLRELPALLWRAVREAASSVDDAEARAASDRALLERCRGAIPEAHRAEFDALLAEARATYHIRDERSLYSDVWAWGLQRSVCLEIGARLLRRDPPLVVEPADAVQASVAELESLLLTGRGPSARELQERAAFQRAYTVRDAPRLLGPAPKPPPPADALPAGARRLSEAVMTLIAMAIPPRLESPAGAGDELVGRGASSGVYEGIAHVVGSSADVASLPPGAVLVVGAATSAFTMLAPLAAAVIAEGGGLLSHVAIVCREYRLPCVCGCSDVLARVRTGDRVRVDGTHGRVTILERAAPDVAAGG